MKRIHFSSFIIIALFTATTLYGQVQFSDAFKETIEKIIKEKVKKGVINWLTEEEPVIGIIGRDLIGQVISSAEKDELIGSVTNVVTSSVFIYNIQHIIETSIPDSTYNHVLQQAKKFDWDEKKLIAYTSLYFYYSERIKYMLYVSPYIFSMEDVKRNMESLQVNANKKWVTEVSRILVRKRRIEKDIMLDVRLLEILQVLLTNQINPNETVRIDSSLIIKLTHDYSPVSGDNLFKLISYWKAGNVTESLPLLFQSFTESISKEINRKVASEGYSGIPFDLNVLNELLSNYIYLVNSSGSGLLDHQKFELNTLRTITQLIDTWISQYNVNKFGFDYGFMLAASYLNNSDEVRFIVLDQLRLGYFKEKWALFLYISGLIDPLLQEAFDSNDKVYLTGLGGNYSHFNLSVAAGIPYENLKLKNVKLAITLGYEIPILDITKNL